MFITPKRAYNKNILLVLYEIYFYIRKNENKEKFIMHLPRRIVFPIGDMGSVFH